MKTTTFEYRIKDNKNNQIYSGKWKTILSASEVCIQFEQMNYEVLDLHKIDEGFKINYYSVLFNPLSDSEDPELELELKSMEEFESHAEQQLFA